MRDKDLCHKGFQTYFFNLFQPKYLNGKKLRFPCCRLNFMYPVSDHNPEISIDNRDMRPLQTHTLLHHSEKLKCSARLVTISQHQARKQIPSLFQQPTVHLTSQLFITKMLKRHCRKTQAWGLYLYL